MFFFFLKKKIDNKYHQGLIRASFCFWSRNLLNFNNIQSVIGHKIYLVRRTAFELKRIIYYNQCKFSSIFYIQILEWCLNKRKLYVPNEIFYTQLKASLLSECKICHWHRKGRAKLFVLSVVCIFQNLIDINVSWMWEITNNYENII